MILPSSFYQADPVCVARRLLGQVLARESDEGLTRGRIVEVEAYLGEADEASHAFRGPTPRNRAMFGGGGHAYVYFTYGMHFCMNVVTGSEGIAGAVLLRALEPLEGLDLMRRRRGAQAVTALCSGPARLAQAMAIDRTLNGVALAGPPLWLEPGEAVPPERVVVTTRVGIRRAADLPLRFYEGDNPHVSRR